MQSAQPVLTLKNKAKQGTMAGWRRCDLFRNKEKVFLRRHLWVKTQGCDEEAMQIAVRSPQTIGL